MAEDFVGKREVGLILQSGWGSPKIESNYVITQERQSQYGFIFGLRDVFQVNEIPVGFWGSSILDTGMNFQLGLSIEPLEKLQLRVGAGIGTHNFDYDSVDSSGQYLTVRRVYGFQGSLGGSYRMSEMFSLGLSVNTRTEVGLILGLSF